MKYTIHYAISGGVTVEASSAEAAVEILRASTPIATIVGNTDHRTLQISDIEPHDNDMKEYIRRAV